MRYVTAALMLRDKNSLLICLILSSAARYISGRHITNTAFQSSSFRGVRSGLPRSAGRHLVEPKTVPVVGCVYIVLPSAFAAIPHEISPYSSLKMVFDTPQVHAAVAVTEVVLPSRELRC